MSTVNKCIRRSNGARVEFRVILNQIQDDKVYKMYQDQIAKDNFRKLFSSSKLRQFKFDIHIRSVMLVRFDEAAVADQLLKDDLVKEIEAQAESPIKVERDIKVEKNELEILSSMVLSIFADLAVDVVKDVLTEVLTDVATEVANQFLSNQVRKLAVQ
ncbi:hypothetical protein B0O80DRAFT_438636 [Mortierella sp. GBAus27b]|nr:hypothetical protein B0O80DRAFT_438636 [Mortierella sp. GBAus27b]